MGRIHTLRCLLIGASNNGGRDGGEGVQADWDAIANGQVVWNNKVRVGEETVGTKFVANTMGEGPFDGANQITDAPAPWAARELLDRKWPIRNAQVISHTKFGTLAPQWAGAGGLEFDHVVDIHAAALKLPCDYFSWMQGGTEAALETVGSGAWDSMVLQYFSDFDTMLSGFISAGVLSADVKTIISGLSIPADEEQAAYRTAFNDDCLIPLAAATPNCAYVDWSDLPTSGTGNVHFPAASYQTGGRRCGVAWAGL